jgi:DNA-binding IclR family transcriptional regulator
MADQEKGKNEDLGRYQVPNLERAIKILELLAHNRAGLNIMEIATELGYPNNSVFRITATLLNAGYVRRDAETKRFSLSRRLLALGYASIHDANIIELAIDPMRRLRDATTESVILTTLMETEGVAMAQVSTTRTIRLVVDPGTRFELHCAAPGKAILAFLPKSESNKLIRRLPFTRFTERTITSVSGLEAELERVRESGHAVDLAECLPGVHCVAAPVFDETGYPIAAIHVTGPSDRLSKQAIEEVAAQVMKCTQQVSQKLGYGFADDLLAKSG